MNSKLLGAVALILSVSAQTALASEIVEEVSVFSADGADGIEKDGWGGGNSPENLGDNYVRRLSDLPAAGRLSDDKLPWSETFWPSNEGSIAVRWQVSKSYPRYQTHTLETLRRMSPEQIGRLSPAEKYDIALGDYQYRVTRMAFGSSSPRAKDWAGICNGWTQAALTYDEPMAVEVVNPDGIAVRFASSDVKGLISFFYAIADNDAEVRQMGSRCSRAGRFFGRANCADVHPASFHIVMANQLGIINEGFAMDADAGHEVWNQPVFAYESRIGSRSGPTGSSASSAVARVYVETKVTYAVETHPQWDASLGTSAWGQESVLYKYWLELDRNGQIVGGVWAGGTHPDFVWMSTKAEFKGAFAGLSRVYRPMGRTPGFRFENQIPTPPAGEGSGNLLSP